jgi:hypothetical protein
MSFSHFKFAAGAGLALAAFVSASGHGRADTIFDVEHARANYRAGLTSSSDVEYLRRWGRPSGHYPQYGAPPPRRIDLRRDWRYRRY